MHFKKGWLWLLLAVFVCGLGYLVYAGSITVPKSVREAVTRWPPQLFASKDTQTARTTGAAKPAGKLVLPVSHPGNPKPDYPERAMERHQEGSVVLNVHVGRDGTVKEAKLLRSSGSSSLDRSALETVSDHWRYVPAKQDGRPVPMWRPVKITFTCRSGARDVCEEYD